VRVRLEQEKAREDVTEVARGVLRMMLPIEIPGLGHVNCYCLVDANGAALVDPGLPGPGTWEAIRKRLKLVGLEPRHIHSVFVTHSHPDHFGGAVRIAKESGARVIAHRAFSFGSPIRRPDPHHVEVSVDDLTAHLEALERERTHATRRVASIWAALRRISTPPPWKGPKDRPDLGYRLRWAAVSAFGRGRFVPEITQHVEHGDVLELAGREWFVLHTPGHTADHICLHDPDSGAFLTGDHVLPSITPHIAGVSYVRDPLKSFFYSLDRVGEIKGISIALPAHGHPFDDLKGRAEAIKAHHHERLAKLKEIGREIGRGDVTAYMRRLFSERSWGDMAESETFAHLEHLRLEGRAEAWRDEHGRLVYEL
jgi:glyoxylase-like metal-dependent hydrolase (beta-lactamase superfamily II)